MSVFNWSKSSIKNKIGGLFLVLLTFLFFVIVYSSYKIKLIDTEMREVAFLDIPLSNIMTQVEFIELEQHLLYEQFRQDGPYSYSSLKLHQQLAFQKKNLKTLLDKAITMIQQYIESKQLVLNQGDHERVLLAIENYQQKSIEFETLLEELLNSDSVTPLQQQHMETLATHLEESGNAIIKQLSDITTQDAYYTERHEQEFLLINSLLGASALVLGLFLTITIIRIILQRIRRIQQEIQTLNNTLDSSNSSTSEFKQPLVTKDELAELELEVKNLLSRLNKEMTSRDKMEQHLLTLATQDKLTGAFNRHKWKEQIEVHINLAQRGNYQFGLILLDIDFFKTVNDRYGHLVGDSLLQSLTATIQKRLRSTDMLFRIGGEEFAILLPMQQLNTTYALAEGLRAQIAKLKFEGLPQCTISAGVTNYQFNDTEKSIFARVDKALYQAKAAGRNRVVEASDNE